MALGLLGAAIAAVWFLLAAERSNDRSAVTGSVAVLPFEAIGEESSPFARGIQLGLLTRLSRLPELAVISEGSVERLVLTETPLLEAGRRLGIAWIVRGDVQRAGDRVQVSARLVDARRDRQIWAETYAAALTAGDLFEIQGRIAREIAAALRIHLDPAAARRVTAVPTEHTAAYELYLQAEELVALPAPTNERKERRIRLYQRALELDPSFAEAWARLAHAYVTRMWTDDEPSRWADSALYAAHRALALDPESAEAYTQIGNVRGAVTGELDSTLEAYQNALELEPSHGPAANNLVATLGLRGRLAEALRWLDRAYRLSPDFAGHLRGLIKINSTLGRDGVADAWIAHARSEGTPAGSQSLQAEFDVELLHRDHPDRARAVLDDQAAASAAPDEDPEIEVTRRRAALALYGRDWSEARRLYRAIPPNLVGGSAPYFRGLLADDLGLAYALSRLGNEDEAREIARAVLREAVPGATGRLEHYVSDRFAVASLIAGDTLGALEWLERSVEAGFRHLRILRTLPILDDLRGHPRFVAILEGLDAMLSEERRRADEEGWGLPPGWERD